MQILLKIHVFTKKNTVLIDNLSKIILKNQVWPPILCRQPNIHKNLNLHHKNHKMLKIKR